MGKLTLSLDLGLSGIRTISELSEEPTIGPYIRLQAGCPQRVPEAVIGPSAAGPSSTILLLTTLSAISVLLLYADRALLIYSA